MRIRLQNNLGALILSWGLAIFLSGIFLPTAFAGNFYAGTSPANVPWPDGIVPYEFTNTLTAAQRQTYLDGLREWELAANVKFVPHTNQTHWILFAYNTNGFDNVSSTTNPQVVSVASLSRAQVGHEMGHSFGFNHENIRPDAANYILVLTNNIFNEPSNIVWFTPDPTAVPYGNYDYESVMHLGWDFESTNPGVLATQQPKPPNFPRYQFRMGNYCLSPGDRAALAHLYPPAATLTNIVTTTADSGPGSLRAAIYYATDHPGAVVKFNIPANDSGYSNGVFNIHLSGHLPPLVTNGMVIDGSTQPGFTDRPLIFVDGSQIIPETFTSDTFLIYSANNQIKNLAFTGFDWNAMTLIYADATNNTISGCWFGLDYTGTNAAPNAFQGILIAAGASRNIIGPGNVLSGNSQYGVYITDSNTIGNVVLGNYIGTTTNGTNALANGKSGVFIGNGATGNIIGGTNMAGQNVLSGNTEYGVYLGDTASNVIEGNLIGLGAGGTNGIGNGVGYGGLFLGDGATNNIIGGTVAGARNVISGNDPAGVFLGGANASGNVIEGNYIGTDITGTNAIGNMLAGIYAPFGPPGNVIGGTVAGARNVISGNLSYGIYLLGPSASDNLVEGNYIGVTPDGVHALGNNFTGIIIFGGASNNIVGGGAGAGNVISGNGSYGIYMTDPGTTGNWIEGNIIGADATGTNALPNYDGLIIFADVTNNFIGLKPDNSGTGNKIAFNYSDGVLVGINTVGIAIRGNSIFSNFNLGIELVDGGNNFQTNAVVTNAFGYATSTIIFGKLTSLASKPYTIDFYRTVAAGSGQGQFYLGKVSVTTDGSGNANFAYTNSTGNYAGQYITATATDGSGNTSEFSPAVLATNFPVASAQLTGPFTLLSNGFIFNLALQTNFNYRIQTTTNLSTNPIPWVDLTNFTASSSSLLFTDRTATNFRTRFYRVVSP